MRVKGFKPRRFGAQAGRKTKKQGPRQRPVLNKTITKVVKRVLKGNAESKMAIWYGNNLGMDGTGLWADRGYSLQNQFINNTPSDLKRLVPFVLPGTDDNQRVGNAIQPTSIRVDGTVKVIVGNLDARIPTDIIAVIYLLEHKVYKSYTSLRPGFTSAAPPLPPGNDFNQLLLNGEETTRSFWGDQWAAWAPVNPHYYRLLGKKLVRLRYAGKSGSTDNLISVANSHDYRGSFSVTLGQKHLPKTLKYPELLTSGGGIPPGPNDPLNFAPFFAVGYFEADGSYSPTPSAKIELAYSSTLRYKDM